MVVVGGIKKPIAKETSLDLPVFSTLPSISLGLLPHFPEMTIIGGFSFFPFKASSCIEGPCAKTIGIEPDAARRAQPSSTRESTRRGRGNDCAREGRRCLKSLANRQRQTAQRVDSSLARTEFQGDHTGRDQMARPNSICKGEVSMNTASGVQSGSYEG